MVNSSGDKYAWIDAMRGCAILGVVCVHCFQELRGYPQLTRIIFGYGALGVQLFFVASAITLCLSMQRRQASSDKEFYLRRFFRIAPLYYTGIVLYFGWNTLRAYGKTHVFAAAQGYSVWTVLANFTFTHGFYPAANNTVVPGGWSIATEMMFYALFPFLFRAQVRLPARGTVLAAVAIAAACLACEVAYYRWSGLTLDEDSFLYTTLVNQLPVFAAGIAVFRLLDKRANIAALSLTAPILMAVAALLWSRVWETGFNGFFADIVSAVAFCLVALMLSSLDLRNPVMRGVCALGKVSFSVYLFHFIIVEVASFVLVRSLYLHIESPTMRLVLLVATALPASYCVACASKAYIEDPGIRLGERVIAFLRRTDGSTARTGSMQRVSD